MKGVFLASLVLSCLVSLARGDGCSISFNGQQREFDSCAELQLNIKLYWTFNAETILVAFTRAVDNEYVGFGFGSAEAQGLMIPNSAVIAFPQDGAAISEDYKLEMKSPSGVIAGEGGQQLVSNDAQIEDGVLTVIFERPLNIEPVLAPDTIVSILYAVGAAPSSGLTLSKHGNRVPETLNLTSATSKAETTENPSATEGATDEPSSDEESESEDEVSDSDESDTDAPAASTAPDDGVCIEAAMIPEKYADDLVHSEPIWATVFCIESAPDMPCGTAFHSLQVDGAATDYQAFCETQTCFTKHTKVNAVYKHRWENKIFHVEGSNVEVRMGDSRYRPVLYAAAHIALDIATRVRRAIRTLPDFLAATHDLTHHK